MAKLILRSFCVGIATLAIAAFVIGFVGFSLAAMATPSPDTGNEVGWDVLALIKELPLWVGLFPLAFFAVGFLIGFLYFSKREKRQASQT